MELYNEDQIHDLAMAVARSYLNENCGVGEDTAAGSAHLYHYMWVIMNEKRDAQRKEWRGEGERVYDGLLDGLRDLEDKYRRGQQLSADQVRWVESFYGKKAPFAWYAPDDNLYLVEPSLSSMVRLNMVSAHKPSDVAVESYDKHMERCMGSANSLMGKAP